MAVTGADMGYGKKGSTLSTLTKRLRTGFGMAGIATLWIFSGNWVFSVGFAMQALLAQLEYYRMAMQKGACFLETPAGGVRHLGWR